MGKHCETVANGDDMEYVVHKFENLSTQSTRMPLQNLSNVRNNINMIIYVTFIKIVSVNNTSTNEVPADEVPAKEIIKKTFDVTLTDRQEALQAHRFQFQSGFYNNIHVTIILQNC